MLAIRMQRTGRKGHAMFRMVVQDAHRTPTSGKVVAQLGSYDPHAKTMVLNKEKAGFYLEHGAQPSDRVALLLKKEGVKLPKWVTPPAKKERAIRNADKRRSTRPDDPAEPEATEAAASEEAPAAAADAAEATETETPAEAAEAPAAQNDESVQAEAPAESPEKSEPAEAPATEDESALESESGESAKAE